MAHGSADRVLLRYLPALYTDGSRAGLTDSELLDRFTRRSGSISERAFEALVERHGPMVFRVCRQMLTQAQDVEDAFQATFLVLLRQASSIRRRESVASWLYGVALRVARRARRDAVRRQTHEEKCAERVRIAQESVEPKTQWPELHEEIARLPAKFQEPIVLCYLRGLTTEETAQWLGCPQGTVLSRLARGRDRLRSRLVRRGLGPAIGILTAAAAEDAFAAVPAALRDVTVALSSSRGLSIVRATRATMLAEGVIWTMRLARWKAAAVAFATLGFGAAGTIVLAQQVGQNRPQPAPAPVAAARPGAPSAGKPAPPTRAQVVGSASSTERNGARSIQELADMEAQVEMDELRLDIQKELLRKAMVSLGEADFERPHDEKGEARKTVEVLTTQILESSRELNKRKRELDLIAKPGDRLVVEVLEALPGRPLSGERVVRPDGTVGLAFYGDVQVAGLTARQIKAKIIEHMKRLISEEDLGLVDFSADGKKVGVDPAESDRVYVEFVPDQIRGPRDRQVADLERRINELRSELDRLKRGQAR